MTKVSVYPTSALPTLDNCMIDILSVNLFQSANIQVLRQEQNDAQIGAPVNLVLDGYQYDDWNQDDEYVVNWALEQLGFTKKDGY